MTRLYSIYSDTLASPLLLLKGLLMQQFMRIAVDILLERFSTLAIERHWEPKSLQYLP